MSLYISNELSDFIKQHAVQTYPFECCGFMYGRIDGDRRSVLHVEQATNSKEGDQRRRFEITPAEYLHAEKQADRLGYELIGIYHSHPDSPAIPSEHDRSQAMPFFSYIIASVSRDEVKDITSWLLTDNREFEQEDLNFSEHETINH